MSVGISPIVDLLNFQLSQVPQYSTFTSLFDQYRIVSVVAVFKVKATETYIGNSSGDIPHCRTAIDYNDNSGTLSPAVDYQTCVDVPMTTSFCRKLVPRWASPVYRGISGSGYVMGSPRAWLDSQYPDVPHYQIVVNIDNTSLDNQFVYEVDVLYTVQFQTVN